MECEIMNCKQVRDALREEALARNAAIGKLQGDKMALIEMLQRTSEALETWGEWDEQCPSDVIGRIDELLTRMG